MYMVVADLFGAGPANVEEALISRIAESSEIMHTYADPRLRRQWRFVVFCAGADGEAAADHVRRVIAEAAAEVGYTDPSVHAWTQQPRPLHPPAPPA